MPRRRPSQPDDFVVSDEDVEANIGQGRRRVSSQTQSDTGFSALSELQQDELTQRFIRIMICRNARKRPIKRADLTKHLFKDMDNLGSKQKVFTGALQRAQTNFRTVLGMEIVEMMKRTRSRPQSQSQSLSQSQSSSTTKAFILVSTLPEDARALDESRVTEIALLTVIAAIIILTPGCCIVEDALYKWLSKIGIHVKDGQKEHKQLNAGNVKELVEKEWPDQWYLEREKEDNVFHFSLGPRLFKELDDKELINFIDAVYTLPGDNTITLDDVARQELQQRLDLARKPFADDDDDDE